jgi:hypothetical protein
MDPRVTMDRHGPIHLGEGQAVALIGDDLGGVRWRTSDKAALAAKLAQIQQFAGSALYHVFMSMTGLPTGEFRWT